jgi:hypothetical protein
MNIRNGTLAVIASVMLLFAPDGVMAAQDAPAAPDATAQDAKPPAKSRRSNARAQPLDPNVLAGPKVEDEALTRERARVVQGDRGRRGNGDVPFFSWMAALRRLGLTSEQQVQVRAIGREFEKAAREFRDSQPDDVREAMRQARQMREQGQLLPRDVREKIVRVEANAPRSQPYQERIWALLTAAQQDRMKSELDQMRTNGRRRMAERGEMDAPPSMERMPMISDDQPGAATQPDVMMSDESMQP